MIKILVNDGIDAEGEKMLRQAGFSLSNNSVSQEDLATELHKYDAVIVRSRTKVRREHIDAAPNLKLIGRGGVGLDNIDVDYAKKKQIEIVNTPEASTRSVAELAMAHMLSLSRWVYLSNVTMRNGEWNKKQYNGFELSGKTLGIVGFGRIGRCLAEIAQKFGMNIIGFGRRDIETAFEYTKSLWDLLPCCDFLSLHLPSQKKPVVDSKFIERMKDGAVLINCSRGNLVDEKALLEALDSGKLRGAGLDVFDTEPTGNRALVNHPNVSVTPHVGGSTAEAQTRIGLELAQKIIDYFQ